VNPSYALTLMALLSGCVTWFVTSRHYRWAGQNATGSKEPMRPGRRQVAWGPNQSCHHIFSTSCTRLPI
jgi:hypothetical protein